MKNFISSLIICLVVVPFSGQSSLLDRYLGASVSMDQKATGILSKGLVGELTTRYNAQALLGLGFSIEHLRSFGIITYPPEWQGFHDELAGLDRRDLYRRLEGGNAGLLKDIPRDADGEPVSEWFQRAIDTKFRTQENLKGAAAQQAEFGPIIEALQQEEDIRRQARGFPHRNLTDDQKYRMAEHMATHKHGQQWALLSVLASEREFKFGERYPLEDVACIMNQDSYPSRDEAERQVKVNICNRELESYGTRLGAYRESVFERMLATGETVAKALEQCLEGNFVFEGHDYKSQVVTAILEADDVVDPSKAYIRALTEAYIRQLGEEKAGALAAGVVHGHQALENFLREKFQRELDGPALVDQALVQFGAGKTYDAAVAHVRGIGAVVAAVNSDFLTLEEDEKAAIAKTMQDGGIVETNAGLLAYLETLKKVPAKLREGEKSRFAERVGSYLRPDFSLTDALEKETYIVRQMMNFPEATAGRLRLAEEMEQLRFLDRWDDATLRQYVLARSLNRMRDEDFYTPKGRDMLMAVAQRVLKGDGDADLICRNLQGQIDDTTLQLMNLAARPAWDEVVGEDPIRRVLRPLMKTYNTEMQITEREMFEGSILSHIARHIVLSGQEIEIADITAEQLQPFLQQAVAGLMLQGLRIEEDERDPMSIVRNRLLLAAERRRFKPVLDAMWAGEGMSYDAAQAMVRRVDVGPILEALPILEDTRFDQSLFPIDLANILGATGDDLALVQDFLGLHLCDRFVPFTYAASRKLGTIAFDNKKDKPVFDSLVSSGIDGLSNAYNKLGIPLAKAVALAQRNYFQENVPNIFDVLSSHYGLLPDAVLQERINGAIQPLINNNWERIHELMSADGLEFIKDKKEDIIPFLTYLIRKDIPLETVQEAEIHVQQLTQYLEENWDSLGLNHLRATQRDIEQFARKVAPRWVVENRGGFNLPQGDGSIKRLYLSIPQEVVEYNGVLMEAIRKGKDDAEMRVAAIRFIDSSITDLYQPSNVRYHTCLESMIKEHHDRARSERWSVNFDAFKLDPFFQAEELKAYTVEELTQKVLILASTKKVEGKWEQLVNRCRKGNTCLSHCYLLPQRLGRILDIFHREEDSDKIAVVNCYMRTVVKDTCSNGISDLIDTLEGTLCHVSGTLWQELSTALRRWREECLVGYVKKLGVGEITEAEHGGFLKIASRKVLGIVASDRMEHERSVMFGELDRDPSFKEAWDTILGGGVVVRLDTGRQVQFEGMSVNSMLTYIQENLPVGVVQAERDKNPLLYALSLKSHPLEERGRITKAVAEALCFQFGCLNFNPEVGGAPVGAAGGPAEDDMPLWWPTVRQQIPRGTGEEVWVGTEE